MDNLSILWLEMNPRESALTQKLSIVIIDRKFYLDRFRQPPFQINFMPDGYIKLTGNLTKVPDKSSTE